MLGRRGGTRLLNRNCFSDGDINFLLLRLSHCHSLLDGFGLDVFLFLGDGLEDVVLDGNRFGWWAFCRLGRRGMFFGRRVAPSDEGIASGDCVPVGENDTKEKGDEEKKAHGENCKMFRRLES